MSVRGAGDSVLDKVRKLMAKASSTDNPNEAALFSAKAAALVAAHRIDPARLAAAVDADVLQVRTVPLGRGSYVRARLALLGAIADVHDCEVVFQRRDHGTDAFVAGFASDLDAVLVLHEALHVQAATRMASVRRATAASTQQWRRAFLFGFAARIGELLRQTRARVEAHAATDAARTATSLPDLVDRTARVRRYADAAFGRVGQAARPRPVPPAGWARGREAASRVDIGQARLSGRRAIGRGSP